MENKNMELEPKGIEAAKKFLVRRHDVEILNEEPFECEAGKMAIVAKDMDRGIVFVDVIVRANWEDIPTRYGEESRSKFEKIAVAFLADYDGADTAVCFDEVVVTVINDSMAFLRYQQNILSIVH